MDRKLTKVDLKELREDAPLTTRMNVDFYEGEPFADSEATYIRAALSDEPASLRKRLESGDETWISDYILIRSFYPEGATLTINGFDEDGFPIEGFDYSTPKHILAHELTHAYLDRYRKEVRGFVVLARKIFESPKLKRSLIPVLESLEKEIKFINSKTEITESDINEAMAYAVGEVYDCNTPDKNPNWGDHFDPESKRFKSALGACQRLIKFVGIDGSRAFVRRKMREIYLSGVEGKTLEEEVDEFEKSVAAFFVSSDTQS